MYVMNSLGTEGGIVNNSANTF